MIEENVKCRKELQNSIDINVSRSFFNVLVSGHRPSRLPKDEGNQQKIKKALQDILDCIHQNCLANKKTLRIFSGNSEGVDQWTYKLNNEFFKVPFYRIATFHNDSSEDDPYVHNIYISDPPSRSESENPSNSLPETWVKATDEIKLDYADLMIAVWDGNYPQGSMGGVVRLLIEALKRHIPVVLVDASSEALGTILLSQTNMINSSQYYRLKIEEKHLAWVKQELFQKKTLEEFENFFCSNLKDENNSLIDLYEKAKSNDPMEKRVFSGIYHDTFMRFFGKKWKKFYSPIRAYQGKQESSLEKTLPEECWQYFDMFDRVATYAANKYRDKVVLIHLLSSFAVLGAVLGSISQSDFWEIFWGFLELFSLIKILFLLLCERRQKMNSHDVWLSFREAAEAFRINAFLRSQLSSLPQIHENIWSEERGIQKSESPSLQKHPLSPKEIRPADPSLWVIAQLFHEAGPPNGSKDYILTKNRQGLIAQMKELIENQKSYHEGNQEKTLKVHENIENTTVIVFYVILVVVTLHLFGSVIHSWLGERPSIALSDTIRFIHNPYTIFFTAFLPALFAALHDIHSQLELNRVAKNSQQMSESLGTFLTTLDTIKDEEDPMALRNLARELAQTLYQEHDAWGKLMKDQRLDVPA